jgi:hypothetical protein
MFLGFLTFLVKDFLFQKGKIGKYPIGHRRNRRMIALFPSSILANNSFRWPCGFGQIRALHKNMRFAQKEAIQAGNMEGTKCQQ